MKNSTIPPSLDKNAPLFNRGMLSVAIAQFFSALADNTLFFVILALAFNLKYPDWVEPVFQLLFVGVYVLTAPFVGNFADRFDKGRVMLLSNSLKLLGLAIVLLEGNPFLGYTVVGLGASLYSPAKYGILGEVAHPSHLVKANGIIEASTIAAILIGAIAGGVLGDYNVTFGLSMCAILYIVALIANAYIPKLTPKVIEGSWNPIKLCRTFFQSIKILWIDKQANLSLIGTSLFWGAGMTLRFLLLAWVPYVMQLTDKTTPSILNAAVAIGIIIGSIIAAKFITLERARLSLWAGILMGICVVIAMIIDVTPSTLPESGQVNTQFWAIHLSLLPIYGMLIAMGICGGIFIVPLNAMLQAKGRDLVGVGKAIAVQNFSENSAMLGMLCIYTLFYRLGMTPVMLGIGFGLFLIITITLLTIKTYKTK